MPSRQRGLKKPSKLHHRVKLRVKSDDQCLLVSLSKEDRDTYLLHEDNVKRFLSSSNLRVSGDFIDSLAQITAKASKVSVVNNTDGTNFTLLEDSPGVLGKMDMSGTGNPHALERWDGNSDATNDFINLNEKKRNSVPHRVKQGNITHNIMPKANLSIHAANLKANEDDENNAKESDKVDKNDCPTTNDNSEMAVKIIPNELKRTREQARQDLLAIDADDATCWSTKDTNRPWSSSSRSRKQLTKSKPRRAMRQRDKVKSPWLPTMSFTLRKDVVNSSKVEGRPLSSLRNARWSTFKRLAKPKYRLQSSNSTKVSIENSNCQDKVPRSLAEASKYSKQILSLQNKSCNKSSSLHHRNYLAKYRYIKPHRDPRQNISISTSKAMYNPYRIPKLAKAVQDNFARRVDLLSNLMGNYDLDEDDASEVHSVYNYDVVRNRKL